MSLYEKISRIQFFRSFKIWKSFYIWKKLVRRNMLKDCSGVLQ